MHTSILIKCTCDAVLSLAAAFVTSTILDQVRGRVGAPSNPVQGQDPPFQGVRLQRERRQQFQLESSSYVVELSLARIRADRPTNFEDDTWLENRKTLRMAEEITVSER